jgi:hypothetical protein
VRPFVLAAVLSILATGCASTPSATTRPAPQRPAAAPPPRQALDAAREALRRGELSRARPAVADVARHAPGQPLTIAAGDLSALLEEQARQAAQLQALRLEIRQIRKTLAEKEDALRRVTATVVGSPR